MVSYTFVNPLEYIYTGYREFIQHKDSSERFKNNNVEICMQERPQEYFCGLGSPPSPVSIRIILKTMMQERKITNGEKERDLLQSIKSTYEQEKLFDKTHDLI